MLTIDTHCHVGIDWFEPLEVLLFQMDRNAVDKAVLIQTHGEFDNGYLVECLERFPGRFAAVASIDPTQQDAVGLLERLAGDGIQGIRVSLTDNPSVGYPIAVLRKAAELGLKVSCIAQHAGFVSPTFAAFVDQVPELPIIVEHLSYVTATEPETAATFERFLELATKPNLYAKVPGLGEIMPRPSPMRHPTFDLDQVPPFIDKAIEAFGAERLMLGTDSPVSSRREGYGNVVGYLRLYLARYSVAQQEAIFGGTAASLFQF